MGRGQGSDAKEEAHRSESAAASEAFLYKVCSYLLSDKDEKKYWVTTYALHEIMNLWLVMMQTQTDAHKKDNLQSCKKAKLRHLRPSVFNAEVLLTCLGLVFFSSDTLSYIKWVQTS